MTRVVGYFSRVHNWNKSKIGELADRHKGNYSVALA
jgi:anaerobic ribonucleoside-triphosphate reductase